MSEPVRSSVTVEAPVDRAFVAFTEKFDRWWPRNHKIGKAPLRAAVLECRHDGRWYERDEDGTECEWGRVLVWEPPHQLVLSWYTGGTWQNAPDPARASTVEVRFIPESATRTRVELEHRDFERHGENWEKLREGVSGGWQKIIELYAASVTA
jgi:uncharacterized protein YndB with AHSA1/START domain